MKTISGIIPVLPIPFFEDESLDEASLRKTADWVASQGLSGMCLPAYGSEFYKLSEAELEQAISIAIDCDLAPRNAQKARRRVFWRQVRVYIACFDRKEAERSCRLVGAATQVKQGG